jgi:phosphatidylserine decarboxylase
MIDKFIKKNNINMNDYVKKNYKSFNEFFVRDLKKGKRKISEGLISVSDSKLSVYDISDDTTLTIKL